MDILLRGMFPTRKLSVDPFSTGSTSPSRGNGGERRNKRRRGGKGRKGGKEEGGSKVRSGMGRVKADRRAISTEVDVGNSIRDCEHPRTD